MFNRISPRAVAKTGLEIVVAANVSAATEHVIEEHTEIDTDSTAVTVGTGLFGWYVSQKLSPITDAIVDRTADRVVAFRNRKNEKTNTDES